MKKQGQRRLRCDKRDEGIFSRKVSKPAECQKGGKHIKIQDVLSCVNGCGKLKSEKILVSIALIINIFSKVEIRFL